MAQLTAASAQDVDQVSVVALVNRLPKSAYPEHREQLILAFIAVRTQTLNLTASLSAEDLQLQSMPDASPGKWHLAHTSWFFEAFILAQFDSDFAWHNPLFAQLFNSYYNAMGEPYPRSMRGILSRPGLDEIHQYRDDVTTRMLKLLTHCDPEDFRSCAPLLVLGMNHEQQHQELILTDIKHALFQNPSYPAVFNHQLPHDEEPEFHWLTIEGGNVDIGYQGEGFCFDNELPRHRVFLDDFEFANRPVNNAEWLEFIQDGGYEQPLLWLADGWAWRYESQSLAPLYWLKQDGEWQQFNLSGLRPLSLNAPVTHINYYEADAYARWAGLRLPTEQEWEHAQSQLVGVGQAQAPGSCWEWTASPYCPYPGFSPAKGNVGEYNGKFMINQMVLRGASGATAEGHGRLSYRNFFYPDARWQFSGLRLVKKYRDLNGHLS